MTATPTEIAAVADAWLGINQPARDGGKWAFAIAMYSALDPSLERPILRLGRLLSALDGGT